MGKKRNRPGAAEEQPPREQDQADNQSRNEIDEIFAKRKKSNTPDVKRSNPPESPDLLEKNAEIDEKDVRSSTKAKKKQKKKKGNEWPEPPPKPRRKTNDGYSVYSAEELGFNKREAGGTPLCPFDCDCCF